MKKLSLLALALMAWQSASAEIVFRRENGAEPKSIDPQIASESSGSAILYDTFEGLIKQHISGELLPGMAESWEVSEDGKKYVFKLREGLLWSDGKPLKASDFVYAWHRAVNPETGGEYGFILAPVKNAEKITSGEEKDLNALGIKALDDRTLEVELENATPYFLGLLTHYTTYPVPQHVVEKHGKEWTRAENIVSNGAYKIIEWQTNSHVTAVKSDTYYDKDKVQIDKVIFYPAEDESAAFKRYRAGELDFVRPPSEQFDWIKKNLPNELHVASNAGTYWYGFNLEKEPFKDNPKLREALSLAIDRQVVVDKVTKFGQVPAFSVVPPGMLNSKPYAPEASKMTQAERNEKAKALYAEAGYSKENPVKFSILYNTSEGHKKIAIAVAAMWKQVLGAEVELYNQEWKVMLQNVREGNYEVNRYAWIGDYNDPNTFLEIFQSHSDMNSNKFVNAEFDAKIKEAASTFDLEKRAEILQEAEKILSEHHVVAPLYHYVTVRMIKPYVKGYQDNLMGVMPTQYLRIEK